MKTESPGGVASQNIIWQLTKKKVRIDDVMDDVIRATHDPDGDVEEINKRSNTSPPNISAATIPK